MNMGEFVTEMGEPIIDEEEFSLIKRLQDLKASYRDDFDKWRELKAEIVYCQNLVEQCRHRLIQEFETWYNEVYCSGLGTLASKGNNLADHKYDSSVVRQYVNKIEQIYILVNKIYIRMNFLYFLGRCSRKV